VSKAQLWSGEDITILPIHNPFRKKLMLNSPFYRRAIVVAGFTGFSGLTVFSALMVAELELQL
jgi:hypothetical protein